MRGSLGGRGRGEGGLDPLEGCDVTYGIAVFLRRNTNPPPRAEAGAGTCDGSRHGARDPASVLQPRALYLYTAAPRHPSVSERIAGLDVELKKHRIDAGRNQAAAARLGAARRRQHNGSSMKTVRQEALQGAVCCRRRTTTSCRPMASLFKRERSGKKQNKGGGRNTTDDMTRAFPRTRVVVRIP
ncbi:unnamed protein product [Arctogadus glacialis]